MAIKLSKISLLLFFVWSLHPRLVLQEIMQLQRLLESRLHVILYVKQAAENAEVFYFISWRFQGKGKLGQLETAWHFLIGSD